MIIIYIPQDNAYKNTVYLIWFIFLITIIKSIKAYFERFPNEKNDLIQQNVNDNSDFDANMDRSPEALGSV